VKSDLSISLKCPLCGKQSPEKSFHPEDFEDDVLVVDVIGLGRGKGFANSEARSAFDDRGCEELLDKLASRTLEIVGLLVEEGLLGKDRVLDKIGLRDPLEEITEEIAGALGEEDWEEKWDIDENEEHAGSTTVDYLRFGATKLIEEFESEPSTTEGE
jgi:hypothetical protein